jgi:hypothetical protein
MECKFHNFLLHRVLQYCCPVSSTNIASQLWALLVWSLCLCQYFYEFIAISDCGLSGNGPKHQAVARCNYSRNCFVIKH